MNSTSRSRCAAALTLAIGTAFGGARAADSASSPSAQARYEQDRAVCLNGKSNQDRATCLKEAGASRDQAKQLESGHGSDDYKKNALVRCNQVPEKDRADCRARITGDATTSTGSARDGGILRERVTVMPAPAAASAP